MNQKGKKTISVVIAAKNEEKNIKEAIESVLWADQIIVIDHYSTDNTAEIAKTYTKNVYYEDGGSLGLAEYNKNKGIERATCNWIFILDADERVSELLKKEIIATINSKKTATAYKTRFFYYFLNKPLHTQFFNQMENIRLFQKGKGKYPCLSNHQQLEIKGTIAKQGLHNPIIHHWRSSAMDLFKKTKYYARQDAYGIYFKGGSSLTKKKKEDVGAYALFIEPFLYFWYLILIKEFYKDLLHGFLIAFSLSYYVTLTHWHVLLLKLRKKQKH